MNAGWLCVFLAVMGLMILFWDVILLGIVDGVADLFWWLLGWVKRKRDWCERRLQEIEEEKRKDGSDHE